MSKTYFNTYDYDCDKQSESKETTDGDELQGWTCGTCGLFYEDDGVCVGHCGYCPNRT